MLIFQIKRIISSKEWLNYVVPFFFLNMPKIYVGRTTLNGEKKRGWPSGGHLDFQMHGRGGRRDSCREKGGEKNRAAPSFFSLPPKPHPPPLPK